MSEEAAMPETRMPKAAMPEMATPKAEMSENDKMMLDMSVKEITVNQTFLSESVDVSCESTDGTFTVTAEFDADFEPNDESAHKTWVGPFEISPVPKAPDVTRSNRRGASRGRSVILTSSPYKAELEQRTSSRENSERGKGRGRAEEGNDGVVS